MSRDDAVRVARAEMGSLAHGRHFDEWLARATSFDALYGFTGLSTTTSTTRGEPFRTGTRWVKGDLT